MYDVDWRFRAHDQNEVGGATTPAASLSRLRSTVHDLAYGAPVLRSPATTSTDSDTTWYPATWLTDPWSASLEGLVKIVVDVWGGHRHVAAALAFKGYAWAAALPVVAGWLRHECVPMLESKRLRIGVADRLPFVRVDLADAAIVAGRSPAELVQAARASLLDGHLREIIDALSDTTRVGTRLLWGSVAESVASIATQLNGVDGARRALDAFGSPLAELVEAPANCPNGSWRRRTCCLWFASEAGRNEYCRTCPVVC